MIISFTKAEATGNDFVIIDENENENSNLTSSLIKKLCNRKLGVGADGLLYISNKPNYDFNLDYYNCDGSWETLCVNGIRCATLYMFQKSLIGARASILCGDGTHNVEINNNIVTTTMNTPTYNSDTMHVCGFNGRYVDSGAKHFIINVDNVEKINVLRDGRKIRNNKAFSPDGINVNFYSINNNNFYVRTYEKGVESEMSSCGSGSVACVFDAAKKSLINHKTTVSVLGGELEVSASRDWSVVKLSGPAQILFSSIIDLGGING